MSDLTYEERKKLRRAAEDARDACNRHYGPFVDVVAHPLNILSLLDMADRAARAQPAQAGHVPEASCGECGKKASDGWALYCVACMEKAGLPAQAGQVLTDDQWQRIADITESFLTRDMKDEIEAVLAKRVPMKREEVKELARKVGYDNATAQERADFINGIRHGERHHGIVGEKGGAT